MQILTRYLLAELAKVFLISLTGLTMMMLIVVVVREAKEQSLPLVQVVRLIPYILPDQLRMTVPVTLLLACTTVYARMSGANEMVAIKALGISPWKMLWPTFALAVLLSLVAVWLNDLAVSWGRSGVQRVVIEAAEEIAYGMLRSQRRYSSPYFALNVARVDGRRLVQPTLVLQARGNSPSVTITADEAELRSDRAEGVLRIYLRNVTIDVGGKITTRLPEYEPEIPLSDASRAQASVRTPSWLPLSDIPGEIVKQRAGIERSEQELAARGAYQMLCGDFDELIAGDWSNRVSLLQQERSTLYRLETEPHRRWSAGFSCLFFVWIGAPIAIIFRNRDFLTSFFVCFLPILVVYYPLLMVAVGMAKNGTLPPYGVWAGNVLLLALGTWLLRRVVRY